MSRIVENIVTNSLAIAKATLPAPTWRTLRWAREADRHKNAARDCDQAVGFYPGEYATVKGQIGMETIVHAFHLVLSRTCPRKQSDDDVQAVLSDLYDYHEQIFKQFFKLNLSTAGVLLVENRSGAEPQIIDEMVFVEMKFTVLYRQQLSP